MLRSGADDEDIAARWREAMWGKLPAPKYMVHAIFKDNTAGFTALKAGEVDVSQQFNANIQDLWL